ncbi:MAG TPA: helix-hairpin-helix domain-containing protein [Chryseolinea sp.]
MLKLKHWIKAFFGFPKSQVNGFVVLLFVTTLMLFSEPLWRWWMVHSPQDYTADRAKLDSLVSLWKADSVEGQIKTSVRELFRFDPNVAPAGDLQKLGFSDNLSTRILRYREKGGKFRIKSDLLKIYGIDSAFYDQLLPFISLPQQITPDKREAKKYEPAKHASAVKKAIEKFDLNNADTSQLKKIYGIGDKLSLRILKYRDLLGGFVSMGQLKEIYGLDSLVINRLTQNSEIRDDFTPVKININTASEKQLSSHPYLNKMAKALVSYRFQHGNFKTVEEIRNISAVDEQLIGRIIPYLTVNDDL